MPGGMKHGWQHGKRCKPVESRAITKNEMSKKVILTRLSGDGGANFLSLSYNPLSDSSRGSLKERPSWSRGDEAQN